MSRNCNSVQLRAAGSAVAVMVDSLEMADGSITADGLAMANVEGGQFGDGNGDGRFGG